ncbi:aminopeptidase [Aplysia californica]|uniref:Aminopeptidase n=1 Tax=Aplysia californica TaxID=6500 RepID=Q9U0D1_APLCA|nr:aminopeptidase [Aplysia californica]AAF18559.1 aminopeptidase [Aplysia californica]
MEQECAFPDVTLADQTTLEQQRALNAHPGNDESSNHGKDTFVILQPRSTRYQLSRKHIVIVIVIVLLILIAAVLAAIFITRAMDSTSCHQCDSTRTSQAQGLVTDNLESISSKTGDHRVDPGKIRPTSPGASDGYGYPWSNIRLPRSLIPSFYEIQLKVDLTKFIFEGSVNISLKVNTRTKYIVFHRSVIDIDDSSLLVRSRYSPPRRIVQQFQVPDRQFHVIEVDQELEMSTTYTLTIGHFSGKLITNLRGLYKSSYTTMDGQTKYLASSQLQATDARRVFPCFDEPDMKARFKVSIIHQSEYTALANMPMVSLTVVDNGWTRRDFATTPVMSTYLLAFVVAEFKSRNHTFSNGYKLKIWARPEAYGQTEHALDFGAKSYDFFTDYFAMADVVPKSDHVAVPDFSSGAMENWGLVIYRETALLFDMHVSSSQNKFMVTLIVAHEIAHTWFGNMVTMRWWDDLWLNEGFASLLMYIVMDHVYPGWNVFAIQVVDDMFPVMVKDALTTSHPVSTNISDPEDIPQHFDSISYNKGMAVLRMLMGFAGIENFRDALRLYVSRYKYSNADMAQLWSTFTESFNNTYDVALIMNTWTLQMGYPMVRVKDEGGHFRLTQTRFLLDQSLDAEDQDTTPFGYKWFIPFTYVTQDDRSDVKLAWLNLKDAVIPKPSSGWLLGNHEYVGFYRVMYEKEMWALLAEQLVGDHTVFPEANRAGLVGDAFIFARADLLDYDIALNLTRYLKKEQSYIPWQAFLHSIEFLRGMISNKAAYVQLQHYLRELVAPVYHLSRASDKGPLPERYLRRVILSMACDVGVEAAVEYAKTMFYHWMNHDNRPSSDLSMLIYSVGIREGGATEWDYVWNKTRVTSVATARDMMLESLVHTQKPWLLWRYINWLFDPDKIRPQNVRVVIGYFSKTPLARMVALQFFMSRWDDLVHTFAYDPFLLRDVIQEVTMYVNTDYHLDQLQAMFEKNTPRGATKAVDTALALIKANIGWMKANYNKITDWLSKNKP